ncbi:MAG: SUMF1/EgtB/PvdO family nonheme iron enzyme [Bacteroidales bacterium]|nr:SUMF1/EgtB/PvdO family nonheme iron enzyme [Bacteroidales bacterium]
MVRFSGPSKVINRSLLAICAPAILAANIAAAQDMPTMVTIPSGEFIMGSDLGGFHADEAPLHKVKISRVFRMSATEITNLQYERFRPGHKALRGKGGFSSGDNEAVVLVTYDDAVAYCEWLSARTGRNFRLPTEAEWEYACRAGTTTPFHTGETLPESSMRNQRTERDLVPVSLETALDEPNAFGLRGMHGGVEEWCLDWYGDYPEGPRTDPAGPSDGLYRVTRGGSHNTPLEYLRSASRSAAIPGDSNCQIGFRVVETDIVPKTHKAKRAKLLIESGVRGRKASWDKPSEEPLWIDPVPFVIAPTDGSPFYGHNHQPAITWCPNGDLLAIWFSTEAESGREMVVLGSRLRKGSDAWDPASLFFKVPDRNMTGSSLLTLEDGTILHVNGVADSGDWKRLCMVVRTSRDNGKTWSRPSIAEGDHDVRHQVIAGPVILSDKTIVQCCDAGPGGDDGTSFHLSRDWGKTWEDTGSTIPGIHAGVVELKDGRLMAFGRGNSIDGRMPVSFSSDKGRSWISRASGFPPIGSGQRLVLKRLQEGPVMLATFLDNGMNIFLSFDEGETWTSGKPLSDGSGRDMAGGAWTGDFTMDSTHSEPKGYFACVQTPDGVIHLISSRLHYRFNLPWILQQR